MDSSMLRCGKLLAPNHARMGKGVTLTEAEARVLYEALKYRFGKN